jgi:hypothetical protein
MFCTKCEFSDSNSFFDGITRIVQFTGPKVGYCHVVQGGADTVVFFAVSIQ